MKKKVLFLLASLALVTTLAVNGTFAQELQETVDELKKWFNDTIFNGVKQDLDVLDVDIASTDTGSPLAPGHVSKYDDTIDWNKTTGVVTRTITAKNDATSDAYVRICVAVRTDMDVLKHQVTPNVNTDDYIVSVKPDVPIGNKMYSLYTFDYKKELTGSENTIATNRETSSILVQLLLTKETTNSHMSALENDFLLIKSFAIESDVFVNTISTNSTTNSNSTTTQMSATEALSSALGEINDFNPFN